MMLKLLAAGLIFTSSAFAATTPYGGRRGENTATKPYTNDEWVQKKLFKLEQDEKRAANGDFRKDERADFRKHLEDNGDWATAGKKTSAARAQEKLDREGDRVAERPDKRAAKHGPGSLWGKNKEDSMEFTDAEARMTRSDRNAAYRTRKKGEDGAAEAAAAAASTNCKTETRNGLTKCLALEALANADDCDSATNKRNQLVCLLWRKDMGF